MTSSPSFNSLNASFNSLNVRAQGVPEPVTFTNHEGESAAYLFGLNPWKIYGDDSVRFDGKIPKVFLYCLNCGMAKFLKEDWSKTHEDFPGVPITWEPGAHYAVCAEDTCKKAFARMHEFVPSKHYLIETELDKDCVESAKQWEYYEEIVGGYVNYK
jgi:hypothetical protein